MYTRTLGLMVLMICVIASYQSMAQTHGSDDRVLLRLPHVEQTRNMCVPASASMILWYYGDYRSPKYLKALATPPGSKYKGTYYRDMIKGLETLGYHWQEEDFPTDKGGFEIGLAMMKKSLRESEPVMVGLNTNPAGHTVVMVGYDEEKKELTFLDPSRIYPGIWTMSESHFEEKWREVGVNCRTAVFTGQKSR